MSREKSFDFETNEAKVNPKWYQFYDNVKKHLSYPDISVYEMLERNSVSRPDLIAYNYFGRKVCFKEFLEQIEICAKSLKEIGVQPKDRVTICMPNTPEAITIFYAVNKIGAVSNIIHPLSAENEVKYYLNISESKVLFVIDLSWEKVSKIIKKTNIKKVIIVSVKETMPISLKLGYSLTQERKIIKPDKSEVIIDWKDFIYLGKNDAKETKVDQRGNDEAIILYSGGTSGKPKGVRLSNLNFNALAIQCAEACVYLEESDKVLAVLPIFHGFGLGICIHTVLNVGACAILLPQFSARTFDRMLKKYKPNIIVGVPTLYEALLNNKKIQKMNLSFLKGVISGGDSLSVHQKENIDSFLQNHGANVQVREGYGLTECVAGSCITPVNYSKKGSIGIPIPDTYYKIVKPATDEEVETGQDGEIVVNSPSVMLGYLNEPSETEQVLKKHKDGLVWLHTGDLGSMDEDGFVYFKQRIKRMIVSSGFNIYPQYVESVINSYPGVSMSCVVAKRHPYKHEVAKAFVVLEDGIESTEKIKQEILDHCRKNLARYSLPYEVEFVKALPRTLLGKVAYNELIEKTH